MVLGPEVLPDKAENLLATVRGSRLVKVTVETAGITTGVYVLFGLVALLLSWEGDAGYSITGEAGESKIGEAGESIVGEAGDSTIVSAGESMIRRDVGSNREDVGESRSGESGGARKGESSPADCLHEGSCLFLVSETLGFFFTGSSSCPAIIWPIGRNKNLSLTT